MLLSPIAHARSLSVHCSVTYDTIPKLPCVHSQERVTCTASTCCRMIRIMRIHKSRWHTWWYSGAPPSSGEGGRGRAVSMPAGSSIGPPVGVYTTVQVYPAGLPCMSLGAAPSWSARLRMGLACETYSPGTCMTHYYWRHSTVQTIARPRQQAASTMLEKRWDFPLHLVVINQQIAAERPNGVTVIENPTCKGPGSTTCVSRYHDLRWVRGDRAGSVSSSICSFTSRPTPDIHSHDCLHHAAAADRNSHGCRRKLNII